MTTTPRKLVFIGLSLSSSWGNGHATTFRALLRGLHEKGEDVLFLERDVPWYANARDLPDPDFCRLALYQDTGELIARFGPELQAADAVIIGSYVPEGPAVIDAVHALGVKALCFYDIDTPVTMAKLSRGEEEYLQRRQVPLFDVYFSFSGGRVLDRLETDFGARRAEALYCSVDETRYRHTGATPDIDLGYLGTYSPDRQPTLERLLIEPARRLPRCRFAVAGPQYPDDIDWPANVERIDHLAPADHAAFYSRQRFTLNVTRADMIAAGWSPSVRLFEAAACRTAIISDRWEGLAEVLPDGEAVLVAETSEDVIVALTEMTSEARDRLANGAMTRVLADHTGRARAGDLLAVLDSLPAQPAARRRA
ncbi:glycosyltransferase [Xaviernesmea oryzae]|uniref:Glycosyltransferase n=1 Tax=Xaviernesmea oryzae TaxID=464029 RepID=A0A1Q9B254_9HYPH|nr:glycosyltransferase [Xaviernesmea oryzae]OLP62088.1 glycosyltransferase [Xaviernesmea oryzae]SEL86972.1 Spore maturation protein CgeB [Xaviernesmea oryzae]